MSGPHWHPETFVCAFKGHLVPAAGVRELAAEHAGLGVDLGDGRRLARCTRCDAWVALATPTAPVAERLPALATMPVPRRGKTLRDALVMRLIALDRAVHSVLFGLIGGGALLVDLQLPVFRAAVTRWLVAVDQAAAQTGPNPSRSFASRELQNLLKLRSHSLRVVIVTALIYSLMEGVEAVGLWRQRRWAEYLTAVATAGFLPFEIIELVKRVTVLRASTFVLNVAILVWLVWKKRLFGLTRWKPVEDESGASAEELFAPTALGTPYLHGDRVP